MPKLTPYTSEELTGEFIEQIRDLVKYWATLKDQTPEERCSGLAFSILSMLDGETDLPAFDLVARPHPEDKAYFIQRGERWIKDGTTLMTWLHEKYCSSFPK